MKKIMLFLMVLMAILVACKGEPVACTLDAKICPDGSSVGRTEPNCEFAECPAVTQEPVACTMDVKVCDDGSYVSRVAPNCEFAECPTTSNSCDFDNPQKKYISQDSEACKAMRFRCEAGEEAFFNECGCGCEKVVGCTKDAKTCPDGTVVGRIPPNCDFADCTNQCDDLKRQYESRDQEVCATISFLCSADEEPFNDECGCGCITPSGCTKDHKECADGTWARRVPPSCEFERCPDEDTAGYICSEEERKAEFCTEIYSPACGWFDETIQCIKYPCAANFDNGCFACASGNVKSWTEGKCPE